MGQLEDILVPIFGIIFVFGGPVVIVWLLIQAGERKQRMMHETLNKMIDNGQEIPAELITAFDREKPGYLHKGLVLLCTGIGLVIFLTLMTGREIGAIGAIPLFIGIAYLILWKLDKKNSESAESGEPGI